MSNEPHDEAANEAALTPGDIAEALDSLPGWSHDESAPALVLERKAPSFLDGIAWVRDVADAAEQRGHHPDIDIRYNTITFRCATHSEGAITGKDVELAGEINRLAPG